MSKQPWLSIEEAPADALEGWRHTRPTLNGRWTALYTQILLRLEQTPRSRALAVRFTSTTDAKSAYGSTMWWFNRWFGPDFIEIARRTGEDGCGLLLVRRGEGYVRTKGEPEQQQTA